MNEPINDKQKKQGMSLFQHSLIVSLAKALSLAFLPLKKQ